MPKRNRRTARALERVRQWEESNLQSRLNKELTRVTNRASKNYKNLKPIINEHKQQLEKILNPTMTRTTLRAAEMARKMYAEPLADSLGRSSELPTQEELNKRIANIARERAGLRASEISETTRTRIANAIARGLERSESPEELADTIVDEVGDMNLSRARTIARTETAVALQTGQFEEMTDSSEALGVRLTKTWLATEDERTRETHSDADGQTVPMDEAFDVGGAALMYPSDPEGPAEEVINCRCAVLYNPA